MKHCPLCERNWNADWAKKCPNCEGALSNGSFEAKPSAPVVGSVQLSQEQVEAWMDRNHFQGSIRAARLAIDDAASLRSTPPATPVNKVES